MNSHSRHNITRILLLGAFFALLATIATPTLSARAQTDLPGPVSDFRQAITQGFGDRQNTYTWSMIWWKGKLYVGTGRSTQCVQQATSVLFYPGIVAYPPQDEDIECTDSPQDLALRAEIWRWTPQTDTWDRVYRSPQDIEIDQFLDKQVARDIGFRSMVVFREADGTEALYVGGVSSNTFNPGVPGARILRSTDGEHFFPIPQAPGTVLGDLNATSFRSMTVYDGKLYLVATSGYAGFGPLYEAANPRGGNNNFRLVLPEDLTIFEMAVYRGDLYVGTGENVAAWPPDLDAPGFSVLKLMPGETVPYSHTVAIPAGGDRLTLKSHSVVSMNVFKDRLYVGTDRPAELYRVNPDGTWDLVVGDERWTPDGIRIPLSGMGAGFDNSFNIHIWRMQTYRDQLFIGTMDQSTKWRNVPLLGERLEPEMGFDLYVTANGHDFALLTRTGFGDMFDVGVRNFAVTTSGLFLGTANQYYGTKLWREGKRNPSDIIHDNDVLLPLVTNRGSAKSSSVASSAERSETVQLANQDASDPSVPKNLRLATLENGANALMWDSVDADSRYHVWRSDYESFSVDEYPLLEFDIRSGGEFHEVGVTSEPYFVDHDVQSDLVYHYQVVSETSQGALLWGSTIARAPAQPISLELVTSSLTGDVPDAVHPEAALTNAQTYLAELREQAQGQTLELWQVEELNEEIAQAEFHIELLRLGLVPAYSTGADSSGAG